ncbi:MAG: hypothetical protein HC897_00645 [Thermoanaerobaculia bacterium]|nr:hypothetical protein [Thermoanaerobaculia bacterium]
MKRMFKHSILLVFAFLALPAVAQEAISTITFEAVPEETQFVNGASQPIRLQGDTAISGNLSSAGEIGTDAGIRFPDGTFQQTASAATVGVTANAGLYGNTIANISPPQAYTEICIKNGAMFADIHSGGDSTAGGNCLPGDVGWIFERFERDSGAQATWAEARTACLKDGMRLPEAYEWVVACEIATAQAIEGMTDNWEWASNSVELIRRSYDSSLDFVAITIPLLGQGSCGFGTYGVLARNDGAVSVARFRCVR